MGRQHYQQLVKWWTRRSEFAAADLTASEHFLDDPGVDYEQSKGFSSNLSFISSPHERRLSTWAYLLTIANVLIAIFTISLLSFGKIPWTRLQKATCIKATSSYSPVLESKTITTHPVVLNGTLFPGPNPSWSRREPDDAEAEAIWESFEQLDFFPLTRQDILSLGKDPSTVARFPDDIFHLGPEAYVATLDIQHKMHCLNELRRMTFADYRHNKTAKTPKEHHSLWWLHLRHCTDLLVQDMLCHADADVLTFRWVDTQLYPFPDFSITRQCRSIDDLTRFRAEHKVDRDTYLATMQKPKHGIKQVPHEADYYALYGFEGSDLYPNGEGYEGV